MPPNPSPRWNTATGANPEHGYRNLTLSYAWGPVLGAVSCRRPDASATVGVIDGVANTLAQHGMWMRVLDGNHDFHSGARNAYRADENGVRPLRDLILDWADRGAVWEWCGVKFGALGGAHSVDHEERAPGWTWWPNTERPTVDDVDRLVDRSASQLDVLLSLDCPYAVSIPGIFALVDANGRLADRSRMVVMSAVERTTPKLLIHGRYRKRHTNTYAPTRTVVEGLGADVTAHKSGAWVVLNCRRLT